MKKLKDKLGIFFLLFIITATSFVSVTGITVNNFARGSSPADEYILLDCSLTDESYYTGLGILSSEIDQFTPFNHDTNERLAGRSFAPELMPFPDDESPEAPKSYFDATISLDDNSGIVSSPNKSLYLWIYSEEMDVRDMVITLYTELPDGEGDSNYISWTLSSSELKGTLETDDFYDIFGWNLLELPFSRGSVAGNIIASGNIYKSFNYIRLAQSSNITQSTVCEMSFYNIYISDTSVLPATGDTNTNVKTLMHQDFYIIKNINFNLPVINGQRITFVGDELNPLISFDNLWTPGSSILWIGKTQINNIQSGTYLTKINIRKQGVNPVNTTINFGSGYKFDGVGVYTIRFIVQNGMNAITGYSDAPDKSFYLPSPDGFSINVLSVSNAVYISSAIGITDVGDNIRVYLGFHPIFNTVTELNINAVSMYPERVKVMATGSDDKGIYIDLKALKAGKTEVVITATMLRNGALVPDVFSTTGRVTVVNAQDNNANKTTKIILWCALGALAIGGIVLGIRAILNVNKYEVK